MEEELTEREKQLWEFMAISEAQNGQIIVPPSIRKECEAVLEKLKGEKL